MNVAQVLHMNGGDGERSYAQNSIIQNKALKMAKDIRDDAIHDAIHKLLPAERSLAMAELGCSSGPSGILVAGEVIRAVYEQLKSKQVNVEVYLNDLPGNDFNAMFQTMASFKEELRQEKGIGNEDCFFYGVPGSFYGRLFRPNTIHFLHSSYCLHFLSQVPSRVGRSHKSNIYLSSESPRSVVDAYYQQYQIDFSSFLSCRSEELVKGGCMVFTLLGRRDDPCVKGSGYIWELLSFVLHQMVTEGLINNETLDTFNIPMYTPSPKEIEIEVNREGSFEIKCLQVSELDWEVANSTKSLTPTNSGIIKCMRSVAEPMLSHHFGQALMDEVFARYGLVLADLWERAATVVQSRSPYTSHNPCLTRLPHLPSLDLPRVV